MFQNKKIKKLLTAILSLLLNASKAVNQCYIIASGLGGFLELMKASGAPASGAE
jgi:hypothetical protein